MTHAYYAACLVLLLGLLPPDLAAQRFRLVTNEAGLQGVQRANGVAVADYDLDGDLDVYLVAYPEYDPNKEETWNRLYRNEGDGTFTDVTLAAGVRSRAAGPVRGQMGNKFGVAWGDYDNDGDPDLFLAQIGPDILFRNEGDGTFMDVTMEAGVAGKDAGDNNSSVMWWDYDVDGDLDLYVSAWAGENRLYENIGADRFRDVTDVTGLGDIGQTWTSIPLDVYNDGLPDLYVVNDFGANRFYLNTGMGSFVESTAAHGLEDPGNGMGVAIGDVNNDGHFEIYVTNDSALELNPLFMGSEGGIFQDEALAWGVDQGDWAWGTEFFDADHDGDVDLYVVNGFPVAHGENYFFVNRLKEEGAYVFEDRSEESQTNGQRDARGLAVFDYDEDGRLDLLVANWDGAPYLYRNETDVENWLLIDLVGTTSNRDAFGAVVSVTLEDETLWRHHDGVDFLGQSITPIHFGLGGQEVIERVTVRWPDGTEQHVYGVAANQRIEIVEGEGVATALDDQPASPTPFFLYGNAPNPFQEATILSFEAPRAGAFEVRVYNLLGQQVLLRQGERASPGRQQIRIEASDLPPAGGLYFYRVAMGDVARTGTMLYVR